MQFFRSDLFSSKLFAIKTKGLCLSFFLQIVHTHKKVYKRCNVKFIKPRINNPILYKIQELKEDFLDAFKELFILNDLVFSKSFHYI